MLGGLVPGEAGDGGVARVRAGVVAGNVGRGDVEVECRVCGARTGTKLA